MDSYIWEKFDHPKLLELKEKYKLDEIVSSGKTEFEKQILLMEWVAKALPGGTPKDYSGLSAFEILEDAKHGFKFWCTEYAFTFLQCATALGWYSRKLGIDYDHAQEQKDRHHGIADIWSNDFNKWYAVDVQHNLHYEKDGAPLNALEIRLEYLKNKAAEVKGIQGCERSIITYNPESEGFNTPSNYFWFFISQRNNFFEEPGLFNTKTYLWVDRYNKNEAWYKFQEIKSMPHQMYNGQFIQTDDFGICFPERLD